MTETRTGNRKPCVEDRRRGKSAWNRQIPDDFYLDGMLYGTALRSQYARARVLSIDTSKPEHLRV